MSQNKRRKNNADLVEKPTSLQGLRLQNINPKTQAQQDVFDAFNEGYNLFLHGVAGTGKTFISLYLAISELINKDKTNVNKPNKIMIVRSTVQTRDMGFLPGNVKEKINVYEDPYRAIFSNLFQRGDAYDILKIKNVVQFSSTSFLRGSTINDTYIIIDEAQNCTYEEIRTIITRVGKNSKLIICGDITQNDLYRSKYDVSGLPKLIDVIDLIEEFDIIYFGIDDIVRSNLVKSFIIAEEKYFSENKKS